MCAAIFNVFEGIPKFFNFKRGFRFLKLIQALIGAGKCSRQSITTHLAVVVHPIPRVLHGEGGPIALLAQLEQPIVAQAVFGVGTGILI